MAAWHARRARRALLCDAGNLELQIVLSAAGAWHCGAPFNAFMVDREGSIQLDCRKRPANDSSTTRSLLARSP